ncbi:ABC transporter permease [Lacrimispora algidixylanolytica]|uniref:ABC transporter permease n=1 Tax=Lacrimispora algidixylanolytica TaxID=94868 RepID=A0A419T326_9FIRM|nr:ABC transporter permease [Lacrimispora algidixylanolytica]RKD31833.1 ABC transporter permease [Lacrimispora algidixylanolytica]
MIKENFLMAWDNIINSKMRSFLTSLGIVIGVASVIALITIVQSVTGEMMSQFESMGADKITVIATGNPLKSGLTTSDLRKLEEIPNVTGVAPSVSITGSAGKQGILLDEVSIMGKNEKYFQQDTTELTRGRKLTALDMDGHTYTCIIDQDIEKAVFPNENPIGQKIMVNGQGYEVVGVRDTDSSNDVMSGINASSTSDGTIIIPYKNALSLSGSSTYSNVDVFLEDTNLSDETTSDVETVLDAAFNYKDDSYKIVDLGSILDTMNSMQSLLTTLLAGIASIALVVGGIGIMNMMLVSVTERTREIGLRKALGAEPAQIQALFIIEALALSLIGGAIGIALGLIISVVATLIIGTTFSISWGAIALGIGFSVAVGLVFGWTPAKKASGLKPIDALRSD